LICFSTAGRKVARFWRGIEEFKGLRDWGIPSICQFHNP
jgi:hypothetical protein